jgi:hypothetical protein
MRKRWLIRLVSLQRRRLTALLLQLVQALLAVLALVALLLAVVVTLVTVELLPLLLVVAAAAAATVRYRGCAPMPRRAVVLLRVVSSVVLPWTLLYLRW